ncbi:MAG: hypothetical protein D6722_25730, partial [Bacteroidetes bacterium]
MLAFLFTFIPTARPYRSCFRLLLGMALAGFCSQPGAQAQGWLAYQSMPQAGIHATSLNPAFLSRNPYRVDIQLFGGSSLLANTYLSLRSDSLFSGALGSVTDSTIDEVFVRKEGQDSYAFMLSSELAGPSLMIAINPKHSVALTSRFRTLASVSQLQEAGARFAIEGLDIPELWDKNLTNDGGQLAVASFLDAGLAYGGEVFSQGAHSLQVGAHLRLLRGLAGAYLYADGLTYSLDNADTLNILQSDLDYAYSANVAAISPQSPNLQDLRQSLPRNSMGLDIGFSYIYRTKTHALLGLPYRARIGLGVRDLGGIAFRTSPGTGTFSGSVSGFPLE